MNVDFNPEALECPRCGKRVLVKRGENQYHCLWCGFRRDISAPGEFPGFLAVIPAAIIILLLLI